MNEKLFKMVTDKYGSVSKFAKAVFGDEDNRFIKATDRQAGYRFVNGRKPNFEGAIKIKDAFGFESVEDLYTFISQAKDNK